MRNTKAPRVAESRHRPLGMVAPRVERIESRLLMSAGQPDPTFGSGGTVTTGTSDGFTKVVGEAVQPDGKTVIASISGDHSSATSVVHLTRLNVNGSLDTPFGTGGTASDAFVPTAASGQLETIPQGTGPFVLVQPDGKLIVATTAAGIPSAGPGPQRFYAVRFDADGSVDPTWDANAAFDFTFAKGGSDQNDVLYSAALAPDGHVYLVGRDGPTLAILRLNTDGSVDTAYSSGGGDLRFTSIPNDVTVAALVDSAGRLVVAGTDPVGPAGTSFRVAVARLRPDGTQDPTFANYQAALSPVDADGRYYGVGGVTLDAVGDIVVDGSAATPGTIPNGPTDFGYFVARFTPTGAADPSLGGTGLVGQTVDPTNVTDPTTQPTFYHVNGIVTDAAGGMLFTSYNSDGLTADGFLTRLDPDGSPDATFATGGTAPDGSGATLALPTGPLGPIYTPATATTAATITTAYTASTGAYDASVNGTAAIRVVRLLDGPTPTPTPTVHQLTGTTIGTAGSYANQGNTAAKATDGNLNTYFDAPTASGAYVGLDLGSTQVVSQVRFAPRTGHADRMVGGVFQASTSATFANAVTVYTVTSLPAQGVLTTVNVSAGSGFRYWRYVGPAGGECNIAEVQLYGTGSTTPTPAHLTGTTIGTAGSYANQGNTIAKATDGNLNTYFDAPAASGAYVGIDLGAAHVVTQIGFAPRSGYASRMVGGYFQASSTADFANAVTVYTVTAAPASGQVTSVAVSAGAAYRYWRYVGPANSNCNVAEVQLFGY